MSEPAALLFPCRCPNNHGKVSHLRTHGDCVCCGRSVSEYKDILFSVSDCLKGDVSEEAKKVIMRLVRKESSLYYFPKVTSWKVSMCPDCDADCDPCNRCTVGYNYTEHLKKKSYPSVLWPFFPESHGGGGKTVKVYLEDFRQFVDGRINAYNAECGVQVMCIHEEHSYSGIVSVEEFLSWQTEEVPALQTEESS